MIDVFAYSCNSAFSTIGTELDMTKFASTAKGLLFNEKLPVEIEYNKSEFNLSNESTTFDIMQTSIGQGTTLVTPIHMAMIASSIANNGKLMKPYLVDKIESSDKSVVTKTENEEYASLMTKKKQSSSRNI